MSSQTVNRWLVRREGSPSTVSYGSAQRVAEALMDGDWEATDEVRGPNDPQWYAFEDHPIFAEVVEEMIEPRIEPPDESKLDMNPLIDVALVLLIFFILTTTYESLRRAIDLPPEPSAEETAAQEVIKEDDIKDRSFNVKMRMEGKRAVITLNGTGVPLSELEDRMKEVVRSTGRKEMYAEVESNVPWGLEAKLYDAAKAAKVTQIYWPKGK